MFRFSSLLLAAVVLCSFRSITVCEAQEMNMQNMVMQGNGPAIASLPSGNPGISEIRLEPMNDGEFAEIESRGFNDQNFRHFVGFTHFAYDDPIIYPGEPGKAHLHMFFGNASITAFTTSENIRDCQSAAAGGTANCSAYWIPAMIDANGSPVMTHQYEENVGNPKKARSWIYYKGGGTNNLQGIIPPPEGLMVIAGNAKATDTNPDEGARYRFVCTTNPGNAGDFATSEFVESIPLCKQGEFLVGSLPFPQCWDGKSLDSEDHKSHVAFSSNGECPSTHPVSIPSLTFKIPWYVSDPQGTAGWRLSSDNYPINGQNGGYSMHGDWIAGWDPSIMERIVTNCHHKERDCLSDTMNDGERLSLSVIDEPAEGTVPALQDIPEGQQPMPMPQEEMPASESEDGLPEANSPLPDSDSEMPGTESPDITTPSSPDAQTPSNDDAVPVSEIPIEGGDDELGAPGNTPTQQQPDDLADPEDLMESPLCKDDRLSQRISKIMDRLKKRREEIFARLDKIMERLDRLLDRVANLGLGRAEAKRAQAYAKKKVEKRHSRYEARLSRVDRRLTRVSNRVQRRIDTVRTRISSGELERSEGNDCENETPAPQSIPTPVAVPSASPELPQGEDPERFDEPDSPSIIATIPGIELPEMPTSMELPDDFEIPGGPTTQVPDADESEPPLTTPQEPSQDDDTSSLSDEAAEVLRITNEERAGTGASALVDNPLLRAAAQAHAEDMAQNDYFSHTGQDGSSPTERARRAGYQGGTPEIPENIASGQRSAASVMSTWMNSSGHKRNILNSQSREIGVGYAVSPSGTPYWVQLFGR